MPSCVQQTQRVSRHVGESGVESLPGPVSWQELGRMGACRAGAHRATRSLSPTGLGHKTFSQLYCSFDLARTGKSTLRLPAVHVEARTTSSTQDGNV